MPVFGYRGLAADGRAVSGVIDADSARTARGKLRTLGIFPTDVNEEIAVAARRSLRERLPGLRFKIPGCRRGLAHPPTRSLLGGGVPLLEALTALSEQSGRPPCQKDDVSDP